MGCGRTSWGSCSRLLPMHEVTTRHFKQIILLPAAMNSLPVLLHLLGRAEIATMCLVRQLPHAACSGICADHGFNFATSTYHFAMTMAHAANAETQRYHQEDESAAVQAAQLHHQALTVQLVLFARCSVRARLGGFFFCLRTVLD